MKYRKDFVTNSSSSSYICDICGREKSGWDISLLECDMYECVNGHIFCTDEAFDVGRAELIIMILANRELTDYNYEELNEMDSEDLMQILCEDPYDLPECVCPICSFTEYLESDMKKYLLKEYKIAEKDVFTHVKEKNKHRKKLYDLEYITYVCQKKELDLPSITSSWKHRFHTYDKFDEYVDK